MLAAVSTEMRCAVLKHVVQTTAVWLLRVSSWPLCRLFPIFHWTGESASVAAFPRRADFETQVKAPIAMRRGSRANRRGFRSDVDVSGVPFRLVQALDSLASAIRPASQSGVLRGQRQRQERSREPGDGRIVQRRSEARQLLDRRRVAEADVGGLSMARKFCT
ncbi:hypothetical protein [Microbacterium gubbeenense]|uniref:hypothetical protein n=1 Tax=Microbacterium gubbeenense TaxID=159896 RepID=UPI003F98B395